jgi:hypothetical protein
MEINAKTITKIHGHTLNNRNTLKPETSSDSPSAKSKGVRGQGLLFTIWNG